MESLSGSVYEPNNNPPASESSTHFYQVVSHGSMTQPCSPNPTMNSRRLSFPSRNKTQSGRTVHHWQYSKEVLRKRLKREIPNMGMLLGDRSIMVTTPSRSPKQPDRQAGGSGAGVPPVLRGAGSSEGCGPHCFLSQGPGAWHGQTSDLSTGVLGEGPRHWTV